MDKLGTTMKGSSSPDGTILLLDSNRLMRATLRAALESAGYLVVTASDLGAAVDRVRESRPDLLITRPYINSMTGQVAADHLRKNCHGLPVLIVAGFMDDDRTNIQNTVEEFHTFPKPFHRDELLAMVRDVFAIIRNKLSG
jgi:DNA-binding NtrC family response regulator